MQLSRRAAQSLRRARLSSSFPNCFSEEEIALLRSEARTASSSSTARRSGAKRPARRAPPLPRTPSTRCSACWRSIRGWSSRCSSCSARSVYVHQFKLNAKAAFEGDVWQWHQDYGTWARDDGMPEARAMNIAVFLDEVMPINGAAAADSEKPQAGRPRRPATTSSTTSYPLWTLDKDTVTRLCREAEAATAAASSRRPANPARC